MKPIISPSILSADFGYLARDLEMINRSEAEWVHIDIMDGVFVPNISIVPLSLFNSFRMRLIVVLFPAPFSPINPTILPFGTCNDTLFSVKPSKDLHKFFTEILFSPIL